MIHIIEEGPRLGRSAGKSTEKAACRGKLKFAEGWKKRGGEGVRCMSQEVKAAADSAHRVLGVMLRNNKFPGS